jgi:hypothetical protein
MACSPCGGGLLRRTGRTLDAGAPRRVAAPSAREVLWRMGRATVLWSQCGHVFVGEGCVGAAWWLLGLETKVVVETVIVTSQLGVQSQSCGSGGACRAWPWTPACNWPGGGRGGGWGGGEGEASAMVSRPMCAQPNAASRVGPHMLRENS